MLFEANDKAFNYYGRWHIGSTAVCINSGSLVEFVYTGHKCVLQFDVDGFTQFPAVFVQVDNGPIEKTTLSAAVSAVPVKAPFNGIYDEMTPSAEACSDCHLVRWWVASHSLYLMPEEGKQWTTLVGGCRFKGVVLDDSASLIPLPYCTRQIEFLGDSLTQGLRMLYKGTDDDIGQQIPYANWPQYVADMLGMKPVVVGFGGQGLSRPGVCGAPPAQQAFPFVYHDVPYSPLVQPEIVVIYQGTNDSVPSVIYHESYQPYLQTVRQGRPKAHILAVCPNGLKKFINAIKTSVAAMNDPKIHFLDYSTGVLSKSDTVDGCHLNPGAAVRLATRLASDIRNLGRLKK